jgi:uncharacterized protein YukE
MRRTNNPNVICPDDLYSQEELLRMEEAAFLEEQIEAINKELQRLDSECNGADNAGDYQQVSKIESRMEDLIDLQITLQDQIDRLSIVD